MRRGSITRFRLNPKNLPKSDWRAFDAMTDERRHQAALADRDAAPIGEAQVAQGRRGPSVRAFKSRQEYQ